MSPFSHLSHQKSALSFPSPTNICKEASNIATTSLSEFACRSAQHFEEAPILLAPGIGSGSSTMPGRRPCAPCYPDGVQFTITWRRACKVTVAAADHRSMLDLLHVKVIVRANNTQSTRRLTRATTSQSTHGGCYSTQGGTTAMLFI